MPQNEEEPKIDYNLKNDNNLKNEVKSFVKIGSVIAEILLFLFLLLL